jgi:hypothetical protein
MVAIVNQPAMSSAFHIALSLNHAERIPTSVGRTEEQVARRAATIREPIRALVEPDLVGHERSRE